MSRGNDFVSSLLVDSNIAFLELPTAIGALRYATLHTWQTDGHFLVNIVIIDKAELVSTGCHYPADTFIGLDCVRIQNGVVSVGHDDDADIAAWRIMTDAEVLLYRYAVTDYPFDNEAEDSDAKALRFVDTLGAHAQLVDYKRFTGGELQGVRFQS